MSIISSIIYAFFAKLLIVGNVFTYGWSTQKNVADGKCHRRQARKTMYSHCGKKKARRATICDYSGPNDQRVVSGASKDPPPKADARNSNGAINGSKSEIPSAATSGVTRRQEAMAVVALISAFRSVCASGGFALHFLAIYLQILSIIYSIEHFLPPSLIRTALT